MGPAGHKLAHIWEVTAIDESSVTAVLSSFDAQLPQSLQWAFMNYEQLSWGQIQQFPFGD